MKHARPAGRPPSSRRGRTVAAGLTRWLVALLVVVGAGLVLYPSAARWVSSVNQAKVVAEYAADVAEASPRELAAELRRARRYNAALSAGALLEPGERKPTASSAPSAPGLDYERLLDLNGTGVMGRLVIPGIDLSLPVYHGTSDETLRQGVGHLEGSHLPVGGRGTHAVLAAHRGLPEATMFDDIDEVEGGDHFALDVHGKVLAYEVVRVQVVQPDETEAIRPVAGKDLVTLVTCTPLGVNSHRILVTGERIDPTPEVDEAAVRTPAGGAGFPWWAGGVAAALAAALWYVRPRRRPETDPETDPEPPSGAAAA